MATTAFPVLKGKPFLSKKGYKQILMWAHIALGDLDKAGDTEESAYYAGLYDGLLWVLQLLHGARSVKKQEKIVDALLASVEAAKKASS